MYGTPTKHSNTTNVYLDIDCLLQGLGFEHISGTEHDYCLIYNSIQHTITLTRNRDNFIQFNIVDIPESGEHRRENFSTLDSLFVYVKNRIYGNQCILHHYIPDKNDITPPYFVENDTLFMNVGEGYKAVELGTDVIAYKGGHVEGIYVEKETLDVFMETHGDPAENSDIYEVPFCHIKKIYGRTLGEILQRYNGFLKQQNSEKS